MQIYPHLVHNDTATVTVRLNKPELQALRRFMHTPDRHFAVGFPNGVRLFYRSKGWYRLEATKLERVIDKLKTALSVLRRFQRELSEVMANDMHFAVLHKTKQKVVAFTSDGTLAGRLHILGLNGKLRDAAPPKSKIIPSTKEAQVVKKEQYVTKRTPIEERLKQLEAMYSRRR